MENSNTSTNNMHSTSNSIKQIENKNYNSSDDKRYFNNSNSANNDYDNNGNNNETWLQEKENVEKSSISNSDSSILRCNCSILRNNNSSRRRWELGIGGLLVAGYVTILLSSSLLPVSSSALTISTTTTTTTTTTGSRSASVRDNDGVITKTQLGYIYSAGSLSIALGKIVTGLVADRYGGQKLYILCLLLISIATTLFAFTPSPSSTASTFSVTFILFVILWSLVQFAHSGGWPALAQIIKVWYYKSQYGTIWSVISFASRAGSICSSLLLGSLLFYFTWRWLFLIGGIATFIVSLIAFFFLKPSPASVGLPKVDEDSSNVSEEIEAVETSGLNKELIVKNDNFTSNEVTADNIEDQTCTTHPLHNKSTKEMLLYLSTSFRFWMMVVAQLAIISGAELPAFLTLFLHENFSLTDGAAATASAIWPAGAALGLIISGVVFDKLNTLQKTMFMFGMTLCALLASVGGWLLLYPVVALNFRFGLMMLALFLIGCFNAPGVYIPMSVFSVTFGGPKCGFVIGIIDFFAYLFAMIIEFFSGYVIDNYGWKVYYPIFQVFTSLLGCIFMTTFFVVEHVVAKNEAARLEK